MTSNPASGLPAPLGTTNTALVDEVVRLVHSLKNYQFVLTSTGCGSTAFQQLMTIEGASNSVLELEFPYARTSTLDLIRQSFVAPLGGCELEDKKMRNSFPSFVSQHTVQHLAHSAYLRAFDLKLRELLNTEKIRNKELSKSNNNPTNAPQIDYFERLVAISCSVYGVAGSGTIRTSYPKRGDHRSHIAVFHGGRLSPSQCYSLNFIKELRSRKEEDFLMSLSILKAIVNQSVVLCEKTTPQQKELALRFINEVNKCLYPQELDPNVPKHLQPHNSIITTTQEHKFFEKQMKEMYSMLSPGEITENQVNEVRDKLIIKQFLSRIQAYSNYSSKNLKNNSFCGCSQSIVDLCAADKTPQAETDKTKTQQDETLFDGFMDQFPNKEYLIFGKADGSRQIFRSSQIPLVPPSTLNKRCFDSTPLSHALVVFPGSFNPLHCGHMDLMIIGIEMAKEDLKKRSKKNSNFDNILSVFELSINNVDKGLLPFNEIEKRLRQFDENSQNFLNSNLQTSNSNYLVGALPHSFVVAITNAPTFHEKAQLFPGSYFVVGFDTAERLVNKKYYQNDDAKLFKALDDFRELGVRFLVAGRKKDNTDAFQTLTDVPIPHQYLDLFIDIPESKFRIDLSSTTIRKTIKQ